MATIKTYSMPNSTILRINSEQEFINISPEYQRNGEVWTLEKKQLLIDSILNDYDIPKLYFHQMPRGIEANGKVYDYAIIDGRQRLEAIWGFLEGEFTLSNDFEYLADEKVNARNFTYADLAKEYPRLRVRFDSYVLPIVLVETDDTELIEDMFSRLNEAVPLNAAEKRNAFGGPMARAIRELSEHTIFLEMVRFSNKRYQYKEVAARFLFIEYCYSNTGRLLDTKKPYLDRMVINFRELPTSVAVSEVQALRNKSTLILDAMVSVFTRQDYLLRSQAIIAVYYMVFRTAFNTEQLSLVTRTGFIRFFEAVAQNKVAAEEDITRATYEYLEFDRLSQQGTNDSSSIRERTRIMCEFLGITHEPALAR